MQLSRRSFLRLSTLAALYVSNSANAQNTTSNIRLGCQMWSINDLWKKDPAGSFKKLRAMGYEGVQSFGFLAMDRRQLEQMLNDNGLRIVDMPFYMKNVTKDKFNEFLEFCQQFRIDFVYEPWWGGKTATEWRKHADWLVEIAAKFKQYGIRTGYHNHQHEMRLHFEGKTPFEFVVDTGLDMELDVGHVKLAGRDPVYWLDQLNGRVPSIHAKPGGGNSVGGAGDTNDWSSILSACRRTGVKWAIVECEERRNTFEDVQASYNYLKPLV